MLFSILYSLYLFKYKYLIILEWTVLKFNSIELEITLLIDWISISFIRLISFISRIIYLYSSIYIKDENNIIQFNYLLLLFILSIYCLIIRTNIIRIIIGWDGLGLISFCLILFYQNFSRIKRRLLTIICNRLGDIAILFAISLSIINGSWNSAIFYFNNINHIIILLIIIAAITKRAQIPFSIWLPAAIAAPTPISALVHSSTLVTAGIYIIIRYELTFRLIKINNLLIIIRIFTCCIASIIAIYEFDLKKIIALSTLRQIRIIIYSLALKLKILAYFHLLTHALFKSLLFICAGLIIHSINNNQDIRLYGNILKNYPTTIILILISRIRLRGFPFIAGFYSKDIIIENSYFLTNDKIFFLIIISTLLTIAYNLRLINYLFFIKKNYNTININLDEKTIIISIIPLFIISIISGALLSILYFYNYNISITPRNIKILILSLIVIRFFIINIYFKNKYSKEKKHNFLYSYFIYDIINISILYRKIYHPIIKISIKNYKILEKGWINHSISYIIIWLILKKTNPKIKFINIIHYIMNLIILIIIFSIL